MSRDWRDKANCKGIEPSLFYSVSLHDQDEARRVCAGCEVRAECLEFALRNFEGHGIWGGLSERQRRRMRRARRLVGAMVR